MYVSQGWMLSLKDWISCRIKARRGLQGHKGQMVEQQQHQEADSTEMDTESEGAIRITSLWKTTLN